MPLLELNDNQRATLIELFRRHTGSSGGDNELIVQLLAASDAERLPVIAKWLAVPVEMATDTVALAEVVRVARDRLPKGLATPDVG